MPVIRVRKRPDETNAIQYLGWSKNSSEIAAFIAAFQDAGDPFFKQASDPTDPTVEATVQNKNDQVDYPLRPGDWVVVGPQQELLVIPPAEYSRLWEPVPAVSVGVGIG